MLTLLFAVRRSPVMTELELFGPQVSPILIGGSGQQGDPPHDAQLVPFQFHELRRVVAHQAQGGDAEIGQDLGTHVVAAGIDRQSQIQVGLDGIPSLILQPVGVQLPGQADTATLPRGGD